MQQSGFPLLIDLNCRCADKPSAPMVIGNTINLSKSAISYNVTQLINMQSMDNISLHNLQNFTASRTDFLLVNEMDMSLFSKNKSDNIFKHLTQNLDEIIIKAKKCLTNFK